MFALMPMAVSNVAELIRLAVAPVFLLTGIGALLTVMTARLGRAIDRARVLNQSTRSGQPLDVIEREELRVMPGRIRYLKRSIFLALSAALLICLVIALLFISSFIYIPLALLIAVAFVLSMGLMVAALVSLLLEVKVALKIFYVDKPKPS